MVLKMILALSLIHAWRLLLTQQDDTGALFLDVCGCLEFKDYLMLPMVGGTYYRSPAVTDTARE